jgi:tetratricopeptide (TPR) repeat protein
MRIAVLIAISLMALVACTAVPETTPAGIATSIPASASLSLNEYLQQGIAFADKGQFQESINSLNGYLEAGGKSATAYYYRGLAYNHQHQYTTALNDLSRAIDLKKGYTEAYYQRSQTYAYLGRWDDAKADSAKVLEIDPQYSAANYLMGLCGIKTQEYGKAYKYFNKTGNIAADKWTDIKDIAGLVIPLNELILLNAEVKSGKTGICNSGTCSAPIGYNIMVRVVFIANPDKSGIRILAVNLSPPVNWLADTRLNGTVYNLGQETLVTNIGADQPYSDKAVISITYQSNTDSKKKESNTVSN